MIQPYTEQDLERGEKVVQELHGLKGSDAWAERIAKEIAAERQRVIRKIEIASADAASRCNPNEDTYQRGRFDGIMEYQKNLRRLKD